MQDLIKRIEAAEGPSRELDAKIWEYLGLAPEYDNLKNNYGCWHYRGEGRYHFADDSSWGRNKYAPEFTSSIDAAMTLVPKGWIVKEYTTSKLIPHTFEVSKGVGIGGFVGHSDHSMALALCAAALRARSANG